MQLLQKKSTVSGSILIIRYLFIHRESIQNRLKVRGILGVQSKNDLFKYSKTNITEASHKI